MRLKFDAERIYLPYCMQRLDDGGYIILNREYQPLGLIPTAKPSNYKNHPIHLRIDGLTPEIGATLSARGKPDMQVIYFFHDGNAPWLGKRFYAEYEKRLARLHGLVLLYVPGSGLASKSPAETFSQLSSGAGNQPPAP